MADRRIAVLLLVSWPLMSTAVAAQSASPLAPTVHTVRTSCYWEADGRSGQIRIVVRTGGFEHLLSTLTVDWLAEPRDSDDSTSVIASTALDTVGVGVSALTLVSLVPVAPGRCRLTVDAYDTHYDEPPTDRWRIDLGKPGQVRIVDVRRRPAGR